MGALALQVREEHAQTEQQFKTLYRSKYLPLKEEVQDCRQDIARLKACRTADAEACEKWRSQVGVITTESQFTACYDTAEQLDCFSDAEICTCDDARKCLMLVAFADVAWHLFGLVVHWSVESLKSTAGPWKHEKVLEYSASLLLSS